MSAGQKLATASRTRVWKQLSNEERTLYHELCRSYQAKYLDPDVNGGGDEKKNNNGDAKRVEFDFINHAATLSSSNTTEWLRYLVRLTSMGRYQGQRIPNETDDEYKTRLETIMHRAMIMGRIVVPEIRDNLCPALMSLVPSKWDVFLKNLKNTNDKAKEAELEAAKQTNKSVLQHDSPAVGEHVMVIHPSSLNANLSSVIPH